MKINEESYNGAPDMLSMNHSKPNGQEVCPECGGVGHWCNDLGLHECAVCDGTGKAPVAKTQEAVDTIFKETLLDTNDWASFIDWWSIPDKTDEEFHTYLKSFIEAGYNSQQAEINRLEKQNEKLRLQLKFIRERNR